MSRFLVVLLMLTIATVFMSGCGSDDDSGSEIDLIDEQVDEPDDSTPTNPPANEDIPDIPDELPPVAPDDFGPAPVFQLADLDGNLVSLDDFKGQVVAVNFWATWCAPCRREVPDFVEIQSKHQDEGFTILGISLDIESKNGELIKDEKAVRDFVEQFNINYPIVWDTENVYGKAYQGFGMPTTVILDKNHRMRFRHNSIVDPVTFEAEVSTLLNE